MNFKRLLYRVLFWRGAFLVSSFLLNLLMARYYGASGSSSIYYIINLYSFVLVFASLSMESGMSFFLARKEATSGALFMLAVGWTLVMSAISLAALKVYFHFFDAELVAQGMFGETAATYIPGFLLITFFSALLYAKDDAVLANQVQLIVNILMIAVLVAAQWTPASIVRDQYLLLFFSGFAVQGLLLAGLFFLRHGKGQPLSIPDGELMRKIYRYSAVAFTANVMFFLLYRVDYWFVKRYCTAGELGNYIQVSKLGQMLLVVPGIFAGVVFPHAASRTASGMQFYLARMSRLAVLLFVLLFVLVMALGHCFFPWLFGETFNQMYLPALLLLPGILCLFILTPLSAYFAGVHRPGVNARGGIAGLALMLLGDVLIIPHYKIAGAAAVSTAGYFVCMLYSLLEFSKSHRISLGTMLVVNKEDWRWLRRQAENRKL